MCVLLDASFRFAACNFERTVAYTDAAFSYDSAPMIMSSAILQQCPDCSSGLRTFVRSSSSSSDWPSRPWPLRRRNRMPPNGVAMPSHAQSLGSIWFWKKFLMEIKYYDAFPSA